MRTPPKFSHVPYASDYMKIAVDLTQRHFTQREIVQPKVLDIPAGNGWIGETLKKAGYDTISADINEERRNFTQADMEKRLPFEDASFDAVICCKGIEHVFCPFQLFSELQRILRSNGLLIITTPNIQNLYSRIQFLCTGYLFQFDPFNKPVPQQGEKIDKGHISPVGLTQLLYWSHYFELIPNQVQGSRYKKRWLVPFLLPFLVIGKIWSYLDWKKLLEIPVSLTSVETYLKHNHFCRAT